MADPLQTGQGWEWTANQSEGADATWIPTVRSSGQPGSVATLFLSALRHGQPCLVLLASGKQQCDRWTCLSSGLQGHCSDQLGRALGPVDTQSFCPLVIIHTFICFPFNPNDQFTHLPMDSSTCPPAHLSSVLLPPTQPGPALDGGNIESHTAPALKGPMGQMGEHLIRCPPEGFLKFT